MSLPSASVSVESSSLFVTITTCTFGSISRSSVSDSSPRVPGICSSSRTRSNGPAEVSSLMTNDSASRRTTVARSSRRVRTRFDRTAAAAAAERSTKTASSAPRDSASIPSAPVPANRSRTIEPGTSAAMLENRPSRAMSETGRTPRGTGANRTPLAVPAITRTGRL